jgi:hypothetical protein
MPDWPRLTFVFIRALMLRGFEYFKIYLRQEGRTDFRIWTNSLFTVFGFG